MCLCVLIAIGVLKLLLALCLATLQTVLKFDYALNLTGI